MQLHNVSMNIHCSVVVFFPSLNALFMFNYSGAVTAYPSSGMIAKGAGMESQLIFTSFSPPHISSFHMDWKRPRRSLSLLQSKVNVTFLRGSQDAWRPVGVTGLLPALSFTEGLVIDFISTEMSRGALARSTGSQRYEGPTLIISL